MTIIEILDKLEKYYPDDLYQRIGEKTIAFGEFIDNRKDVIAFYNHHEGECLIILHSLIPRNVRISVSRIMKAIDVSLYNSRLDTKKIKTGQTYLSSLLLTESECAEICSQYRVSSRNPLAFMFDVDNIFNYKSLLETTDGVSVRYGDFGRGSIKYQLISPGFVSPVNVTSVHVNWYHPVIWYLLKENRLSYYINHYIEYVRKNKVLYKGV